MRLSIDEAVLVTLLKNSHLGSESSILTYRIRERMFQGAKVPGNENSRQRKYVGTKVPVTVLMLGIDTGL